MSKSTSLLTCFLLSLTTALSAFGQASPEEKYLTYTVDPRNDNIRFFSRDDKQQYFGSILNLKNWLNKQEETLVFATNGGLCQPDHAPAGLFIAEGKTERPLNTGSGKGNFYIKPNGIFYITTDNRAVICATPQFKAAANIKYATQSGPMLVVNGRIHPELPPTSSSRHIRNGVGILPDNRILFAQSRAEVTIYEFARYFQSMGCKNALYFDGFVSRTYQPDQNWIQEDGNFGILIGVTVPQE
jgi:uncharacterized protein YigE (DUF2233 family)